MALTVYALGTLGLSNSTRNPPRVRSCIKFICETNQMKYNKCKFYPNPSATGNPCQGYNQMMLTISASVSSHTGQHNLLKDLLRRYQASQTTGATSHETLRRAGRSLLPWTKSLPVVARVQPLDGTSYHTLGTLGLSDGIKYPPRARSCKHVHL